MKNMMQRIRNRQGFTLVELMIVVAIIGILAAIAIPAFLRSVKKSKASEAEGNVKKMMDGAKGYFTGSQKFVNPTKVGDQPWHDGTANSNVGYDVPWAQYVFPGGDAYGGMSTANTAGVGATVTIPAGATSSDDIAAAAFNCANAPTGGSKWAPFTGSTGLPADTTMPPPASIESAVLNKLGMTFEDPTYFTYEYVSTGDASRRRVLAGADCRRGRPLQTLEQVYWFNCHTPQEVYIFPRDPRTNSSSVTTYRVRVIP